MNQHLIIQFLYIQEDECIKISIIHLINRPYKLNYASFKLGDQMTFILPGSNTHTIYNV